MFDSLACFYNRLKYMYMHVTYMYMSLPTLTPLPTPLPTLIQSSPDYVLPGAQTHCSGVCLYPLSMPMDWTTDPHVGRWQELVGVCGPCSHPGTAGHSDGGVSPDLPELSQSATAEGDRDYEGSTTTKSKQARPNSIQQQQQQ